MDTDFRKSAHEKLSSFIKEKKMRNTLERYVVLDKALEQRPHFDIDELYKDIQTSHNISRGTVYNTIEILCECGILHKHFLHENQAAYELADDRHLHLICLKCGAVSEMKFEDSVRILHEVDFGDFHPTFASTNIYGLCANCTKK